MHGSYRGVAIAALVVALLIAFGCGAYLTGLTYPKQPDRYQTYQSGKDDKGGPLSPLANVAKPVMQKTPCDQPQSETESDLCAQWRAAKAAEKSADWTALGVIASIAGISLLLWQIMLTREAVEDTGRATDAMREANAITTATEDARLILDVLKVAYGFEDELHFLEFDIRISNIGRCAAHVHYVIFDTDDYIGMGYTIEAGQKRDFDKLIFYGLSASPPCYCCGQGGERVPDMTIVLDQSTPLRGRFTQEFIYTVWENESGWRARINNLADANT